MQSKNDAESPFETYRARLILAIVVAFSVTSTISTVLRFVGKRMEKKLMSSDDWVIIAAQICVYGLAVVCILGVVHGNVGHHIEDTSWNMQRSVKTLVAVQCLYSTSLALTKISVCLFCNRLLPFNILRIIFYTIIAAILSWVGAIIISSLISCRLPLFQQNKDVKDTHCIVNEAISHIVFGVIDVVVDLAILLTPLQLLWKMQWSHPEKFGLLCIYGVGISVMIVAVLRTIALITIDITAVSYTATYTLVYSFLGPAIGVSVASAPLYSAFLRSSFLNSRDHSDDDVELQRIRSLQQSMSLPSFVTKNVQIGRSRRYGRQEEFITTQVLEDGNWSQASLSRTSFDR